MKTPSNGKIGGTTYCSRGEVPAGKWCVIRHVKSGRVLDVAPDSEFVIAYPTIHRGPNQLWRWEGEESSTLRSRDGYGLIREERTGRVLKCKNQEKTQRLEYSGGILKTPDGLLLGFKGGNLTLESSHEESEQKWEFGPAEDHENYDAKPASSCHLKYEIKDPYFANRDEWSLSCNIKVKSISDATFFCVVGWSPGGYAGIQEIDSKNRVAIFSLWNGEKVLDPAIEVSRGENVTVSEFDGEGTGLKCMMPLNFKLKEIIGFVVEGKYDTKSAFWVVSCYVHFRKKKMFVASLKRQTSPLTSDGFYSFAEDWNRIPGACGHAVQRCAEFSEPEYNGISCGKSTFKKVMHGCDAYAKDKTLAKRTGGKTVLLSTGGDKTFSKCEDGTEITLKTKPGFACF